MKEDVNRTKDFNARAQRPADVPAVETAPDGVKVVHPLRAHVMNAP